MVWPIALETCEYKSPYQPLNSANDMTAVDATKIKFKRQVKILSVLDNYL